MDCFVVPPRNDEFAIFSFFNFKYCKYFKYFKYFLPIDFMYSNYLKLFLSLHYLIIAKAYYKIMKKNNIKKKMNIVLEILYFGKMILSLEDVLCYLEEEICLLEVNLRYLEENYC